MLTVLKIPMLFYLLWSFNSAYFISKTLKIDIYRYYMIFSLSSLLLQIVLIGFQYKYKDKLTKYSVLIWLVLNMFNINPWLPAYTACSYLLL